MRTTSMRAAAAAALLLLACGAQAQDPQAAWEACVPLADQAQRLACFDAWAEAQRRGAAPAAPLASPAPSPAPAAAATPAPSPSPAPEAVAAPAPAAPAGLALRPPLPPRPTGLRLTAREGCRDTAYSELSRFWELEPGADCGTFGLRGFHPVSMAVVRADTVNTRPRSDNPLNNATRSLDYGTTETRLQLSVRTKLAHNLLTRSQPQASDSLWFAYTQQSYWQLFNPGLSRPFRSTDHEPELIYVLPLQAADPQRWRLRFAGAGVVHQSNGQSLPLSRSWNRAYLMAGAEYGRLQLHGRLWKRLPEEAADDDNPGISNFIGRAEARLVWHADRRNLWSVTARHSLHRAGHGSWRLEWFRTLGDSGDGPPGGLQLHTQFFSGYGDTLLDYNRRRSVFSIGLSLVEW